MPHRRILLAVIVVFMVVLATAGSVHRLVDRWRAPDFKPRPFQKLLIIGISDNREARHQFENKFVSFLRGRGMEGVTSYSIVPNLQIVEDEDQIVKHIQDQGIDGAITVRVIRLKGIDEDEWGAAWRKQVEAPGDLRDLVDDSLPVSETKARKYGIEVALWETDDWGRVWAARTDTYSRKELENGAPAFVEMTMNVLIYDELL